MTTQRPQPRIGDTAWFVEWCYDLGLEDEEQDYVDRDACKSRTRRVATKEEAIALAKEVWIKDDVANKLGHVAYWPATFTAYDDDDAELCYPRVGYWCEDDEIQIYEGEE